MRTEVVFVSMPFAGLECPSIGLGLLKAALRAADLQAAVIYGNLLFAEDVGLQKYMPLERESALDNEWIFAEAAFPDFRPDPIAYFENYWKRLTGGGAHVTLDNLAEQLQHLRRQAAPFIDRLARRILEYQPRIVGCSSVFAQHTASLALLRRVQELQPEIMTLIGGSNCEGALGLATLQTFPWVDFVVSGEADALIGELCRLLLAQGKAVSPDLLPAGVLGPAYRQTSPGEGDAVPRSVVERLDTLPVPDYDDYFQALATLAIGKSIHPTLLVETSRGCWWGQKHQCTFCGLNGKALRYRSKSPERVLAEFAVLTERYHLRRLEVVDNMLDLAHIKTVLPALATVSPPYNLFYEVKANLTRQHLQQLADAHVRVIQPGIESLHDGPLRLMNKGTTALQNLEFLKNAREVGITLVWHFLCGFPGELETWYAEVADWLPLVYHLQPPSRLFNFIYQRFSAYHLRQADFGIRLQPETDYAYIYPGSPAQRAELAIYFTESGQVWSPEKQRLQQMIQDWKQVFWIGNRPSLTMRALDGRLEILDLRPCRVQGVHLLQGLARQLYLECRQVRARERLPHRLEQRLNQSIPAAEIADVIETLKRQKLLLELNGHLLGLAVWEGSPELISTPQEGSFGWVDLRSEIPDLFKKESQPEPDHLQQVAEAKRLMELWGLDAAHRERLQVDPASFISHYQLHLPPEQIAALWESEEQNPQRPLPLFVKRYRVLIKDKADYVKRLDFKCEPVETDFQAWRKRQIQRVQSAIGTPSDGMVALHAPLAIKLSHSPAQENGAHLFHYTVAHQRLWTTMLAMLKRVIGLSAGYGLCYWNNDPFEHPDYEKFLEDFQEMLGVFPPTCTGAPLKDPGRTRALLQRSQKPGKTLNQFLLSDVQQAQQVFAEFTPAELLFVELLTPNLRNGDKQLTEGFSVVKRFVSGFLINMVERQVELITPCAVTDRWPSGYWSYGTRSFADIVELEAHLQAMIQTEMHVRLQHFDRVRFRRDLHYTRTPDGFSLQAADRTKTFQQIPSMGTIGDLIQQGTMSAAEIAERCEEQEAAPLENTLFFLNRLFAQGIFDEEPLLR